MIEVAGAPILAHNVRLLAKHGVSDIIVNLHYRGDVIEAFLRDGSELGVQIAYSHEDVLLGTAGAAKKVEAELSDPFFLLYGDNLSTCNLTFLRDLHEKNAGDLTMAVFEREDVESSGVVEMEADDRIHRFVEKPKPGETSSHWVNAGIFLASKAVLAAVPARTFCDFGSSVLPALLATGRRLYGYRMSEHLWWIDSPADYERTLATAPAILLADHI